MTDQEEMNIDNGPISSPKSLRKGSKANTQPKRRRNCQGDYLQLQGRVDMAIKLLDRITKDAQGPHSSLADIAKEILEGK